MMKFFGGLLLAIGILIATLSGLCSAWFLVMTLSDTGSGGEFRGTGLLPFIAVIGGLPFLSGIGLFYWGRWLLRRARERGE
ncbi:MAG: hypothetical protein ABI240_11780 [Sphingomonas sp.]